jgi:hypothetical protein
MSILINEAYANPSTPLWDTSAGGGSADVRMTGTSIGSLSYTITDGQTQKFFSINMPPEYVGKAVRITFNGGLASLSVASGTYFKLLAGIQATYTNPLGTAIAFAYSTMTSSGTAFNNNANISVSMVYTPTASDSVVGIYMRNLSGVSVTTGFTAGMFSIELLEDLPAINNGIITAV